MSNFYKAKRTYSIFNPLSQEPFKLSRSKIDLFLQCPRCFYLDRRLGTDRPPGFPFTLNSAVDKLLKKEFDLNRVKGTKHPLMEEYKIDAIPFAHKEIEDWRNYKKGIWTFHEPTNLVIMGAIDDVWVNKAGELIVVDYKATAKTGEVSIDADWQDGYKRQIEIYQWLFRKNGFKVSDTAIFVYCNGQTDREAFDKKIEFDIKIIPYIGNDDWVEGAIINAHKTLMQDIIPQASKDCDYCAYNQAVAKAEG
ncbi:MAG: PD-(D/E)XK nuclease family protein [Desulfobacteraceae bacterium]|nr:PD-(D/E)XK nuclease family protein [Patescibacteria group bacterium]MBU4466998.1 PD-(D/E)XK nuclease family protein [Patescibacteria group bacterium]MCG2758007.1 PD-(D/E)XK nuclease family protein [Desulfobacteraceae bacterium]